MAVLFIPMLIAGIILIFKNPSLLKKRLNAKEEEKEQKSVVVFITIVRVTKINRNNG